MLADLLEKRDWMMKIDLKDAYYCVAISQVHQKFFRFRWKGVLYEYQVPPFGLASAPRTFTKLLKPVMGLLRRLGLTTIIYLDDLFLCNKEENALIRDRDTVIWVLQTLGFVLNWEKSHLTPTRTMEFLGLMVDSDKMSLWLPSDKAEDIKARCSQLLDQEMTTVRELSQVVGKLTSTIKAVLPAPLHYRHLQMERTNALMRGRQNYEAQVLLTEEAHKELKWWMESLEQANGKRLITLSPDLVITTDASKKGWGAVCLGEATQGQWGKEETGEHINLLELRAARFAIMAFAKNREDLHIHMRSDNSTTVAQINKMGGTRSIGLLKVSLMQDKGTEIWFRIDGLTKTKRPSKPHITLKWAQYDEDSKLDVTRSLRTYVERTGQLRGKEDQLFISHTKPHKAVETCTIARWLKRVMESVGIDVGKYKAHSTRAAATSRARQLGLSVEQIVERANWSRATTFHKFHNKEVQVATGKRFQDKVLQM